MKNKIINSTIVETPKLGVSTNIGTNINNIAKKGQPQGIAPTVNIKTKHVGVPLVGTQNTNKQNP